MAQSTSADITGTVTDVSGQACAMRKVSQSGFKNFIIPKISLAASAREDAKLQPGTINNWMIDGLDNKERVIGITGFGHRSQAMPLPRNTANCGKNYCVIVLYR
ncbi:MAG TPA: hypothetical protein VGG81_08740 [Edaphobacter sp.]|jgi:hypothetical protein